MPGFSGQPSHKNPDWAPFLDMTGCRTSQLIVVGVVFK